MSTTQNDSGKKKILIGLVVALLLCIGVGAYYLMSESKKNEELQKQKVELEASFKSLSDTLDISRTELQQYASKNEELNKTVAASQEMIENQKKQIASLLAKTKMTSDELAGAKQMLKEYEKSITDMQTQLAELAKQNQQLSQQNQQLSTDLTTEKKNSNELSEQNKGLTKKVAVGSLLKLSNLSVEAVKKKSNGKETTVKKAKDAENLKVYFETGENKVLNNGPLNLFVRIISPKGETLTADGSGTVQIAESQSTVQYSKKATIDWDQSNKKVTVYWGTNVKDPGTYKIEVYQSGYLVGKGEIKLN